MRAAFPETRILANDIAPDRVSPDLASVEWTTKDAIYEHADVITLHRPLTSATNRLIGATELARMKPDVVLVNTSRGNMIVEADLAAALRHRAIGGAAVDVFGDEPYDGELCELDNCLLTTHLGSMARDCRARMELAATQEVVRFFNGEPLRSIVPDSEHALIEACS